MENGNGEGDGRSSSLKPCRRHQVLLSLKGPRASVDRNAWVLKHYVEELFWDSGKRVILLGHNKGGVDAAAALSLYWHDLKDKVGGLALVQSPFGGTPVASDILRRGQFADKQIRRIMELIVCKLIKGDLRALEDLTYDKRREFILKHKLPRQIPLISFHSEASIGPSVLATMTQIAHDELPSLPLPDFDFGGSSDGQVQASRKLLVVIPISAAMAICALLLLLRNKHIVRRYAATNLGKLDATVEPAHLKSDLMSLFEEFIHDVS